MAKSKYDIDPNNPYAGLTSFAEKLSKSQKSATDARYIASALPYTLAEEFRKQGDPALDAAIVTKQQQVLGGGIEGLNKYQMITNPFERRAMAEKFQSGLTIGLDSLTSEKTRRQGKFEEYINKYAGLYGAQAAMKESEANQMSNEFNIYKSIADQTENTRRYNLERADKAAATSKTGDESLFREYITSELNASRGKDGKVDPAVYARLRDEAYTKYGTTKGTFDSQFSSNVGNHEYEKLGLTAPKDTTDYKQQIENNRFAEFANAKSSEKEAKYGEYYWKNGKIYLKKNWAFDEEVYAP